MLRLRSSALALLVVVSAALTLPATGSASEIDGACAWPVRDNADLVNIAFPDESAHYWGTLAFGIPETGVVIRGRYPKARYFSLHTYHTTLGAADSLADHQIDPVKGKNPFRRNGGKRVRGGRWEVRILPGDAPAKPEPNTMYVGSSNGLQNPAALVLYRVYVPDDPKDPEGGVGLPTVNVLAGGNEVPIPFSGCSITPLIPETQINQIIRDLNWPDGVVVPSTSATDPPEWKKFFGFGETIADMIGVEALTGPLESLLPPGGFLNNRDNSYLRATISREYGEVVVMRARTPKFPDTRAGVPAWKRSQVRYWSVCENHSYSQRYVACLADHEAVLGKRRKVTIVVSDPEDRPRNATRENGVNWMPWGGAYPSGLLIYRQMIPSPRFDYAFEPVQQGDSLPEALGPYMPKLAYCTKKAFEREGVRGCDW